MANAKKCDRCGCLYEEYGIRKNEKNPNAIMGINIDAKRQYWGGKIIDLCPECMGKLKEFIKFD